MRIVAGKYRSRIIKAPNTQNTRPTSDMVRESLFNALGFQCQNASCLDVFAGSGALGIEAISRGAKKCIFIDNQDLAIAAIKENLNTLKIENAQVMKKDYTVIASLNESFDLIFFDPPYKMPVFKEILSIIEKMHLLNETGIIVYESNRENMLHDDVAGFRMKQYFHRDTVMHILKKINA